MKTQCVIAMATCCFAGLLAVAAKMFAYAPKIKSGGSAGMLIPSMYMGGLVGAAAFYLLGELGLYAGPNAAVYVATGMAAALTSIAGVPLASIALVLEWRPDSATF